MTLINKYTLEEGFIIQCVLLSVVFLPLLSYTAQNITKKKQTMLLLARVFQPVITLM